jgi:general secretion pathway protein F
VPVYRYKGVAAGNRAVAGMIDAESVRTAREKLRAEGVFPTEIAQGKAPRVTGTPQVLKQLRLPVLRGVPDLHLALFSSQLATLLNAGVPLLQSLSALSEQVDHERLRSAISAVREEVNQGSTLADALESHGQIFDELYCSMVRSGESSGALGLVLSRLASYIESRMQLRNRMVGALAYPLVVLGASFAVALFLLVYVVPNMTRLLRDLNQPLPLITRIVVGVSEFLVEWWMPLLIAGAGAILLAGRLIDTARGRRAWDSFKLRIPVLGRLMRFVSISRFARTLSTLVTGGLNIVSALDISRRVTGNVVIGRAAEEAKQAITKGASIAGTLRQTGEFPPLVTHMIAVGEASGELDTMLARVADVYDQLVQNALDRMLAVLPPVSIMLVGGVVVIIILSTLLPLLNLTSAL